MQALFTIGYEKANPEDFVATLSHVGIDVLVDVREKAMSRRKGFAKTALRSILAAAAIAYRHEPCLGSPSAVRNRLKKEWDYDWFFREYEQHLEQQTDVIDALSRIEGRVALLCYERNPNECHRSSVGQWLAERTGLQVQHLGVRSGFAAKKNPGMDACQSVSPA